MASNNIVKLDFNEKHRRYQGASTPPSKQPRWCVSDVEEHGKRPISPHTGKYASKTRRDDMGTLAQAKAAIKKGYGTHVGIVIWKEHFDDGLVCLDLDDPNKHGDAERACNDIDDVARRAEDEYLIVEQSVSGSAYHVWAMGPQREQCPLHHAKANVEYFDGSESHYVVLTSAVDEIDEAACIDGADFFGSLCEELGGYETARKTPRNGGKGVKLPFADVLETLGEPVRIDRSGEHWYSCPHPDHTDDEPSFSVRDNDGLADFNCFVCDTPENNKTGRLIARMAGGASEDAEWNEGAFADAFVETHGQNYLWTVKSRKWWRYWNGVWHQDDVMHLRDIESVIAATIPADAENVVSLRARWHKNSVVTGCAALASRREGIACRPEELDKHDHLLGVPGGKVWDFEKNTIREATREDRVTHTLGVVPALSPPEKNTLFDKVLLGYLKPLYEKKSEAKKARLGILEHIGAALACDKSFQSFLVVSGPPGGGKSTLIKFVRHAFGEYAGSISGTKLAARFESHDTWKLVTEHSRLVVATELPKGGVFQSEFLSELVEQDSPVRARGMREDEREFVPKASLMLACNEIPRGTGGLFRRIYPIYFTHRIDAQKVDKDLGEKLKEHAPAMLAAARQAYMDACARGRITTPKQIDRDRKAYMAHSEPHVAYANERIRSEEGGFLPSDDLYEDYKTWCEESGLRPMAKQTLSKRIADVFDDARSGVQRRVNGKRERGVSNIRLRHDLAL